MEYSPAELDRDTDGYQRMLVGFLILRASTVPKFGNCE